MKKIFKGIIRLFMMVAVVLAAFFLTKNWKNRSKVTSETEKIVKKEKAVAVKHDIELSPRQKIVYAIIKGKKSLEMKDLLMRIPSVTERTLRRDLLKLQEAGLITKQGTTKASSYVLNK